MAQEIKYPLQPHHDCRDYTVYHVAGEYYCEHESHGFSDGVYLFTDFGFTPDEVANEFYEDWNKPNAPHHLDDKEMKEFFDQCVRDNHHYHPLEIK